jgi:hypothetical protein
MIHTPALAQPIEAPDHGRTGRARRGRAIYAADATMLDFIAEDQDGYGYPRWVMDLPQLPAVRVTVAEYATWTLRAASRQDRKHA